MKLSLCEQGCIYAKITLEHEYRYNRWRGRERTGKKELVIFCRFHKTYIEKIKEECNKYGTTILTEEGIKKYW